MEKNMRKTWYKHAMDIAETAMQRSEDVYRKVGACILGKENEVLAVSYNGLGSGKNVDESFWEDRNNRLPFMIHAETNVLARVKRGEGKIIACTLLPCSSCATNIVAHDIKTVLYKELYDRDQKALEIFKFYGVECIKID
jgi:dCMP deaminase